MWRMWRRFLQPLPMGSFMSIFTLTACLGFTLWMLRASSILVRMLNRFLRDGLRSLES